MTVRRETPGAEEKARALYEARRSGVPIPPFTDAEPELDVADGYAIAQWLLPMLLADGDHVVGHKVGASSAAAQRALGLAEPDHGPVLASTVHRDGAAVPIDRFIQPRIEAEIVFVLGERLVGPGLGPTDVAPAIAGAAAAMEIVDSRIADWRVGVADTVADLASSGAVAVSSRLVPLAGLDPRLIGVTLTRAGAVVGTGAGAAAMGDPLAVVAWLANTLGAHGAALEPGHLIMTGSLHAPVPMAAGDVFRAEFDRLGPVTVRVTPGEVTV